jgi:NAD(P)-dependent dehydrogenase (short-subunit alcohol dehydrogenase family)
MRKNKTSQKGTIICTASNAGIYPFPIAPMYAVSKHAVVGAVRSMAKPLEADGIRINGLCPNVIGKFIQTFPFMQVLIETATNIADGNLFANMAKTPMSSLTSAVNEIMLSPQLTGVTLEISGEKVTHRMPPEWVDEISKSNFDSFWALGYA